MSDDKNKDDHDGSHINANEAFEMEYWTKKLNISSEQLADAIMSTGTTNVREIQDYLRRMKEK